MDCVVESLAALNAGFAKLADDDGYFKVLDEGQEFMADAPAGLAAPDLARQSG